MVDSSDRILAPRPPPPGQPPDHRPQRQGSYPQPLDPLASFCTTYRRSVLSIRPSTCMYLRSSYVVDLTVAQQSMDYDVPRGKLKPCQSIVYSVTIPKGHAPTEPGSSRSARTSQARRGRSASSGRARTLRRAPERARSLPTAVGPARARRSCGVSLAAVPSNGLASSLNVASVFDSGIGLRS